MNRPRNRGGGTCSVAICPSPARVTYHTFPKDPERLQIWIAACHRKDPFNTKHARICSNHFRDEDYDRDLRNELLNLPTRKLLKPNAIPTLNLLPSEIIVDADTAHRFQSQQPTASKRGRKRKVVITRSDPDPVRQFAIGSNVEEDSDTELYEAEYELNDQKYIKKEFLRMRSRIKYLESKLSEQQKELADLRKFKRNFISGTVTLIAQDDEILTFA